MSIIQKTRMPITASKAYVPTIYMLAEHEDNSLGLSKRENGKTQAAMWKQLQVLYTLGYIKKSKAKKNAYAIVPEKCRIEFEKRKEELIRSIEPEVKAISEFLSRINE